MSGRPRRRRSVAERAERLAVSLTQGAGDMADDDAVLGGLVGAEGVFTSPLTVDVSEVSFSPRALSPTALSPTRSLHTPGGVNRGGSFSKLMKESDANLVLDPCRASSPGSRRQASMRLRRTASGRERGEMIRRLSAKSAQDDAELAGLPVLDERMGSFKRMVRQNAEPAPQPKLGSVAEQVGMLGNTEVMNSLCNVPVDVTAVRRLVHLRPSCLNLRNDSGWTALHLATQLVGSRFAQDEVVQLLLRQGANLYLPDCNRMTPFTAVVAHGARTDDGHHSLRTVCEAIRQYQLGSEPRVTSWSKNSGAVKLPADSTFAVSSMHDLSPDAQGAPLLYRVSPTGVLRLTSCSVKDLQEGGRAVVLTPRSAAVNAVRAVPMPSSDRLVHSELLLTPDGAVVEVLQTAHNPDISASWAGSCVSYAARKRWGLVMRANVFFPPASLFARGRRAAQLASGCPSPKSLPRANSAGVSRGPLSPISADPVVSRDHTGDDRRTSAGTVVSLARRSLTQPLQLERGRPLAHWEDGSLIQGWRVHVRQICSANPHLAWQRPPDKIRGLRRGPPPDACLVDVCVKPAAVGFARRAESGAPARIVFEVFVFQQDISIRRGLRSLSEGDTSCAKRSHCFLTGMPVAVRATQEGELVCLSAGAAASDALVVFSVPLGHVFYSVRLGSVQQPIDLHTRSRLDAEATVAHGGGSIRVSSLLVTLENSVEMYKLTMTREAVDSVLRRAPLGVGVSKEGLPAKPLTDAFLGGGYTAELYSHAVNSSFGGRFSAQFHPAQDAVILLRGSGTEADLCLQDMAFRRNYFLCKLQPCWEVGERDCTASVLRFGGANGFMRINTALGTVVVYDWARDAAAHLDTSMKRYVNVCFAPVHARSMTAERYRIKPPVGFVSLVFTDVQSSTELWENAAEYMELGLEHHNNLLRKLLLRYSGYEVKTEGDAFMCAFEHAIDGLNWCLAAQLYLRLLPWPQELLDMFPVTREVLRPADEEDVDDPEFPRESAEFRAADFAAMVQADLSKAGGPDVRLGDTPYDKHLWRGLRVRMGLHCCRPLCREDPETGRMDYFGPPVNLAARVSGVGKGGQIVVSGEASEQLALNSEEEGGVQQAPICDVQITPIGKIQLKGIKEEKSLFEVLPALLRARSDEFYAVQKGSERRQSRSKRLRLSMTPNAPMAMYDISSGDVDDQPVAKSEQRKRSSRAHFASVSDEGEAAGAETYSNAEEERSGSGHDPFEGLVPPADAGLGFAASSGLTAAASCRLCKHKFTENRQRFCPMCGTRRGFGYAR